MKFTEEQEAFFTEVEEGSTDVLLDSLAGTGKTTTMVEAVTRARRDHPNARILCLTFSRHGAEVLASRMPAGVAAKSFNTFGFGQLFRSFPGLEVDTRRTHKLVERLFPPSLSGEHRNVLVKLVELAKAELANTPAEIDVLVDRYEDAVEVSDKPTNFLVSDEGKITRPTGEYEGVTMRSQIVLAVKLLLDQCAEVDGTVDLSDQVWLHERLGLKTAKFDLILIDEGQDTNEMQLALAYRALSTGGRLMLVGDPRQAIFGFRGAGGSLLINRFLAKSAKHMHLSVTFRCPQSVVAEVQEHVPLYQAASTNLPGEIHRDVAWESVSDNIEPGAFVICRTNAPIIKHCLQSVKSGVRAMILGRDFGFTLSKAITLSRQDTVPRFLRWLDGAEKTDLARMREGIDDKRAATLRDRNQALRELCEGLQTTQQLLERVSRWFAEQPDEKAIVYSTVHQIKGKENENVYVLVDSFKRHENEEEANVWYVALTRTKRKLVLCVGGVKPPKDS